MCQVELFICMAHKFVHGVKLTRCEPLVKQGYDEESEIIWVKTLFLTQEEGCEGHIFSKGVTFIQRCPSLPCSLNGCAN